jgi:photosystem II stability/assembly factor-like uncharacterized protein
VRPFGDHYLPGVYVSEDGGENWSKVTELLRNSAPVGISPLNPRIIYGHGQEGVIKSTDGGESWVPVGSSGDMEAPVEFIGESAKDRGKRRPLTLEIRQFVFDPTDENIVYLVANKGVYRTIDGGKTWCLLPLGFDVVDAVTSAVINPLRTDEILVATRFGLLRSRDRGCSFTRVFPR